eukprot:189026_1
MTQPYLPQCLRPGRCVNCENEPLIANLAMYYRKCLAKGRQNSMKGLPRTAISVQREATTLRDKQNVQALKYVGPMLAKVLLSGLAMEPRGEPLTVSQCQPESSHGTGLHRVAMQECRTAPLSPKRSRPQAGKENFKDGVQTCPLLFTGGQWKARLLLDHREIKSLSTQAKLRSRGVECQIRSLPLGDMLWTAVNEANLSDPEVLLGYIIERKTCEDLEASIIDKRSREQNFRLIERGMGKVMYLLEGKPVTQRLQAYLSSCCIGQGFSILYTDSLRDSVDKLFHLHFHISARLRATCSGAISTVDAIKPLMTYEDYETSCVKDRDSRDIRTIFGMQLRQVTGCSTAKVLALLGRYPTPRSLMLSLEVADTTDECMQLLDEVFQTTPDKTFSKSTKERIIKLFLENDYSTVRDSSVLRSSNP